MDKLQTETEIKLTWWPTPQDYNEAIQVPKAYLEDSELKAGLVYSDAIGLPRAVTGSFASVYRMHCAHRDFALRLFLRNISGQDERYALISDFVQNDDLPYTVTFHFLKKGIKIRGDWFPALKMEWVDGTQFDDYVVEHLANPAKLDTLATKFLAMMDELQAAGIAHGDLQHGNIIMCHDEIRLVDYDGMYVPAMKGFQASELGHRNYQHPKRDAQHFGPYLDNFSAWIIYASIRALQVDSRLLHQLGGGDDCLLFRQSDFADPLNSAAFAAFEKHDNAEIKTLGRFIRAQLNKDLADIPYLKLPVPAVAEAELDPVSDAASGIRQGPRLLRGNLPEWLEEKNLQGLSPSKTAGKKDGVTLATESAAAESWAVVAKPVQASTWITPSAASAAASLAVQNAINAQSLSPYAIPPELVAMSTPRPVAYYEKSGKSNPKALQMLMLLSPTFWLMLGSFNDTGSNEMQTDGVKCPAVITSVDHYSDHNSVTYEYKLHSDTFMKVEKRGVAGDKPGDKHFVYALSSNPRITERLDQPVTTEPKHDFSISLLWILFHLAWSAYLWIPSWKAKRLAKIGMPRLAKIEDLKVVVGEESKVYQATISYTYLGSSYSAAASVSDAEYRQLVKGSTEVILIDPDWPQEFVIYRFCRYHPVATTPQP